jgi:hypothetical protein
MARRRQARNRLDYWVTEKQGPKFGGLTCKPQHVSLMQHCVVVHYLGGAAISVLNLKQVQTIDATQTNLCNTAQCTQRRTQHNRPGVSQLWAKMQ